MKTNAAIMRGIGHDWEVTELELDPPKNGEVLVRFVALGDGSKSRVPANVPAAYTLPIPSIPIPAMAFGALAAWVTVRTGSAHR